MLFPCTPLPPWALLLTISPPGKDMPDAADYFSPPKDLKEFCRLYILQFHAQIDFAADKCVPTPRGSPGTDRKSSGRPLGHSLGFPRGRVGHAWVPGTDCKATAHLLPFSTAPPPPPPFISI